MMVAKIKNMAIHKPTFSLDLDINTPCLSRLIAVGTIMSMISSMGATLVIALRTNDHMHVHGATLLNTMVTTTLAREQVSKRLV